MYRIKFSYNNIYLVADLVPDDEEERLFALEIEGSKFSTKKQFWSSKKD